MPNTISHVSATDSRAVILYSRKAWNGTTLEDFVDANFNDYLLTPTRMGTASDLWTFEVPAGLPPGEYEIVVYSGAAPVVTDTPIAGMSFSWDGSTAWMPTASAAAKTETLILHDTYGNPVVGAQVWITRSIDPEDIIIGVMVTDEDGECRVQLVPGNYYRWATKAGVSLVNPQSFTISA